jgi:hypothetical protein
MWHATPLDVERSSFWFERNRRLAEDFDNHAATLACFVTLTSIQAARQGLGRSPRCTATKVGKSDCEGTFAGASGNDKDASIPAVLLPRSDRPLYARSQHFQPGQNRHGVDQCAMR